MAERQTDSASMRTCSRCGAELPANVPQELCPKCLLGAALPTPTAEPKTVKLALTPAPAPARGMPQPGEQFGHYRIERLLGQGGMGAVFDAQDLESGRRVALKVLSQSLDSPEARQRFLREGRVAASINHPNSVYVFGTKEIGGTPVIAMELVAGGTLQERVRAQGPLPVAEAVDCVLQIIAGLEAAQRLGILHRDIKPSNCFRDADGTVKIGDFGLSISTAVRTEPALTATGVFLGTPAFCSPEQLRGDELNVRSDMYSVGATLFYLLTGHTPFEGKNTVQLLATVLEQRAPSPRRLRPAIPQGLAKAVLRCLEKQPGGRFKNYHELTRSLAPYSSGSPTPAMLGLRFLAGAFDQQFIGFICMFMLWLTGRSPLDFMNIACMGSPSALALTLTSLAASILYYTLPEGIWGASLGKAICRLRVVGPDRNVPGIGRALARTVIYVVAPMLPFWFTYGINLKAFLGVSTVIQTLMGLLFYVVLALLFCPARRRNGFAAVQDLVTNTRVISRTALESRPLLMAEEPPPPAVEAGPAVGPYHVLDTLEQFNGTKWLLGYDLRLFRKVWIHVVPPGTAEVPAALRNIGRAGRLRWLSGRRSTEENWDAFEAASGKPLVNLAQSRQAWSRVRYWLYDLAREMSAAAKDGTLPPVLTLDRVWITADGRAKLFDFPAPGLDPALAGDGEANQSCGRFFSEVAVAALTGRVKATAGAADTVTFPLPLHAREFLERLPELPDADSAAGALKPLLERLARVTRWRRAALVAGCFAAPLILFLFAIYGMTLLNQWNRSNPGMMELMKVLQTRTAMNLRWAETHPRPTDRQFAIYIASHYRSVVTNDALWTGAFSMSLIKGEDRRFAERSIAEHPAPTEEEKKESDAALQQYVSDAQTFDYSKQPWMPFKLAGAMLVIYVCIPALSAALLFRGGLLLLIARVTFVRKNGMRASRLRVFWRALVAWSPLMLGFGLGALLEMWCGEFAAVLFVSLLICGLAILSVALPERGLQDRLAGVWPVPR